MGRCLCLWSHTTGSCECVRLWCHTNPIITVQVLLEVLCKIACNEHHSTLQYTACRLYNVQLYCRCCSPGPGVGQTLAEQGFNPELLGDLSRHKLTEPLNHSQKLLKHLKS